jgi:hypothetical protein
MKNIKLKHIKATFLFGLVFTLILSCERELSDEAVFAKFSTTGDIFTDTPIGLGSNFYFPYAGSKADAASFDGDDTYDGTSSIRIDVPNASDTNGNYAGAILRVDGAGRNLTGYNALTFWAKASQGVAIDAIGFGEDFEDNKYQTSITNISLGTGWQKYIVPIPDPSKLIQERGMLRYAAGTMGTGGFGYTFWLDEIKFENLGSISKPMPFLFGGDDLEQQSFTGSQISLGTSGYVQEYNWNGKNVVTETMPAYYKFLSSNTDVAIVDEFGIVALVGSGTATITAQLAGVLARGSLKVNSGGPLATPPQPMTPAADVKSIYSDAYTAVTTSNFTPNFGGSTTETIEASLGNNSVQIYSNNNFTGIIFDNTVDASTLTHLHIDIYTQKPGTNVNIQIRDVGANGEIETNVNNGNPIGDDKDKRFDATGLTVGVWTSLDIPLDGGLATQKNNLGALILAGGPDFILDNIYFYKQ